MIHTKETKRVLARVQTYEHVVSAHQIFLTVSPIHFASKRVFRHTRTDFGMVLYTISRFRAMRCALAKSSRSWWMELFWATHVIVRTGRLVKSFPTDARAQVCRSLNFSNRSKLLVKYLDAFRAIECSQFETQSHLYCLRFSSQPLQHPRNT